MKSDGHQPLIEVRQLCKDYPVSGAGIVRALNQVSLSIAPGEVLGVVGESGCGKSTLGRCLLRLSEPTSGQVFYKGQNLLELSGTDMKRVRRDLQIVFQDPFGSLNPRHTIGRIVQEPLVVHNVGSREQRRTRVAELLELVGLPVDAMKRYPHEFSGGQRQRVAIARALALEPTFLIADEAVSALDVSIQSQIINLVIQLRKMLGLSMMFISHDLSVIRHVSDRIAVMYLGRIVETGTAADILDSPRHPYTKALISAIPHPMQSGQERIVLDGDMPDPSALPVGCAFNTRCPGITDSVRTSCQSRVPELLEHSHGSAGRAVACHLFAEEQR